MAESGEAVSESRAMARGSCPIKLNELGEEGWELVAVTQYDLLIFGSGGSIGCNYIFKRPKDKGSRVEPDAPADS